MNFKSDFPLNYLQSWLIPHVVMHLAKSLTCVWPTMLRDLLLLGGELELGPSAGEWPFLYCISARDEYSWADLIESKIFFILNSHTYE